jgi:hypothetical protein
MLHDGRGRAMQRAPAREPLTKRSATGGAKVHRPAMCRRSVGSARLPAALGLATVGSGDAAQEITGVVWRLEEGDAGGRGCGHRDKQGQTARDERTGENDGAGDKGDNPEQDERDVRAAAKRLVPDQPDGVVRHACEQAVVTGASQGGCDRNRHADGLQRQSPRDPGAAPPNRRQPPDAAASVLPAAMGASVAVQTRVPMLSIAFWALPQTPTSADRWAQATEATVALGSV